MKKSALLLITALVSSMLYGQIALGPKIGINVNRLSTDMSESITLLKEQSKSGLQVGAFARVGGKTYIQPEILISGRGGKINLTSTGSSPVNYEYSMTALDIPVLIGNKIFNTPVAKLRMFGGPVASFNLNKKLKINELNHTSEDIHIKDAIWAIAAGAGVDVLMFTFDIRYELGLNNISSEPGQSMKSRLFNVSLGWKIF